MGMLLLSGAKVRVKLQEGGKGPTLGPLAQGVRLGRERGSVKARKSAAMSSERCVVSDVW